MDFSALIPREKGRGGERWEVGESSGEAFFCKVAQASTSFANPLALKAQKPAVSEYKERRSVGQSHIHQAPRLKYAARIPVHLQ